MSQQESLVSFFQNSPLNGVDIDLDRNPSKLKLIYITAPDKAISSKIAKTLVEEKLVACVNILGPLESHYIWEDELVKSEEVLLLAKTTLELETSVINRVREIHPYECPCIISLDISNGNSEFLAWVRQSVFKGG